MGLPAHIEGLHHTGQVWTNVVLLNKSNDLALNRNDLASKQEQFPQTVLAPEGFLLFFISNYYNCCLFRVPPSLD